MPLFSWLTGLMQKREVHPLMNKPLLEVPLLAVDLELTSLNPKEAHITSIGWIEGKGNAVALDTAFYEVIQTNTSLAQSPVIHGLTETEIKEGIDLYEPLSRLSALAENHVLLFHNASLDMDVLSLACRNQGITLPNLLLIDTMQMAIYLLQKQGKVIGHDHVTLSSCRARAGLPPFAPHNALDDALATLQLWFTQCHALQCDFSTTFAGLLHTQAVIEKKLVKSAVR